MAVDSGTYGPEVIARRLKMAEALLGRALTPQTIEHPAQGFNQMAQALLGGLQYKRAEDMEREGITSGNQALLSALGLPGPGSPSPASATPAVPSTPPAIPSGPSTIMAGPDAQSPLDTAAWPAGPVKQPIMAGPIPRGIRNNNPLNIEAGPFTQKLPGFVGADPRFAKFETPEQGILAADKLLGVYGNKGLNTVSGIINRWAPPTADNNPTSSYAATVAKAMGIDPNQPIDMNDPAMRQKLIAAMGQFENGRPITMPGPGPEQPIPASMSQATPQPQEQIAQALTTPTPAAGPSVPADQRQRIATLLANPYTRKIGQQMLIAGLTAESKPTDEMREYQLYRQQGGPKSFFDYKADLKKAGSTQVTVDQRHEAEFDKSAGKHQAERFDKIVQAGLEAQPMKADIEALRDISTRITPGKTAEITAALGPYAEALGAKIEGLDDLQAFKAIVSKLTPRMRVPGSGATSDFEMRTFMDSLPGLGKTPQGNEIISKTFDALFEYRAKAAEIASRALSKEIKPAEAEKLLRELPDPMTLWKKSGKTLATAKPEAAQEERKTLGGKNYVKRNGQWFEE